MVEQIRRTRVHVLENYPIFYHVIKARRWYADEVKILIRPSIDRKSVV